MCRGLRFGPKVGQIGNKWDKYGIFKDQFSTFWLGEPKYTETDLESPRIFTIWDQSDQIRANMTSMRPSQLLLFGDIL